jgi:hypothetical protein
VTGAGARGVRMGWRFAAVLPEPGPPPARPAAAPLPELDPEWASAQRRLCQVLVRPARIGALACALAAVLLGAWPAGLADSAGNVAAAGLGATAAAAGAAWCAGRMVQGRRRTAAVIAAERERLAAARAELAACLASAQREHAASYRAWQRRKQVFDRQRSWLALELPAQIDRVDIAGGTLAGWSAALVTIAAPLLAAGGEVTVLDLTEGCAASDLISFARGSGVRPLVWVLPDDLPRLDLGAGLSAPELADVLALAAAAAAQADHSGARPAEPPAVDPATDCALLERVLAVLPPEPLIAQVTAALRALADVGDPRADLRSGILTAGQLEQLARMFGRGASERIVLERAFVLEARLRRLDWLGAERQATPSTRLRVAALHRRAGVIGNRMIGTYLVAAATHMLRQAPRGDPWAHALCLLGAERLGGDVLDRLADACAISRTGLVLAFRAIPAAVRERLGTGDAAVAFMRIGNGEQARAASELIGTEHRLVLGQLTETVGASVTATWGDSYTSTIGTADSVTGSYSVNWTRGGSRGRGQHRALAPFGDFSRSSNRDYSTSAGESAAAALTAGISAGTSWGASLSRAAGESSSVGRTAQRSRELVVEPDELQRLPVTAMIVSYPAQAGRTVVLTDANPAIRVMADS